MEKLKPMTDFVLEQSKLINDPEILARLFVSYAVFLEQPLTLGIFVPCDLDGNVLEHPNMIKFKRTSEYYNKKIDEFQLAESKVLFKGFKSRDTRTNGKRICFQLSVEYRNTSLDQIDSDQYGLFFYNSSMNKTRIHKVEDLLKFNKLVLTESAKKQIGIS